MVNGQFKVTPLSEFEAQVEVEYMRLQKASEKRFNSSETMLAEAYGIILNEYVARGLVFVQQTQDLVIFRMVTAE